MMRLITVQDRIKQAAENWKRQYWAPGPYNLTHLESEKIYNQLKKAKTEEDVAKVIGNDSWTRGFCSICMKGDKDIIVELGNDDSILSVCEYCITEAFKLVTSKVL